MLLAFCRSASNRLEILRFEQRCVKSRTGNDAECALDAIHGNSSDCGRTVAEDKCLVREVAEHHEHLTHNAGDDRAHGHGFYELAVEQKSCQQRNDELDRGRAGNVQAVACYEVGKARAESGRRRAPPRAEQKRRKQHDRIACVDVAADRRRDADNHRRRAAERSKQRREH